MRGLPLLGVLPRLIADPAKLFVEAMNESDEVVPLLRHIMLDNHRNYPKGPLFQRADIMLGNGLVLNHGASWLRQRRMMQPPFSAHRLSAIVPIVVKVARERIDAWPSEPIEMWREMSSFTMSALLRAIFGMEIDDALIARIDRAFDTCSVATSRFAGPRSSCPSGFRCPAGRRRSPRARSSTGSSRTSWRRGARRARTAKTSSA